MQSIHDKLSTIRNTNADELLKFCPEALNNDDYNRRRISEQLEIERQIFPECIQAPVKYYNKRKSLNVSSKLDAKKTSHALYPGELLSPSKESKMENSVSYVQKWLDRYENNDRKPFSDLNVNSPIQSNRKFRSSPMKRSDIVVEKANENISKRSRKRTHFKTTMPKVENQASDSRESKKASKSESKKLKKELDKNIDKHINISDRGENVLNDNEPIVIDDSQNQSQIADKDKLAWLAVIEAAEKESNHSTSIFNPKCLNSTQTCYNVNSKPFLCQDADLIKVPFYKKSYLEEPCHLCKTENVLNGRTDEKTLGQSKDVSIIIENNSFITTIKMCNVKNNLKAQKKSTKVQTDITGASDVTLTKISSNTKTEHNHSETIFNQEFNNGSSEDLFTAEVKNLKENNKDVPYTLGEHQLFPRESNYVTIPESESEDDLNQSEVIEVTAEVHRANEQVQYDALAELGRNVNQSRERRGVRGPSPNTSDSSEKENYNPNRVKSMKHGKKDLKKATRRKTFLSRL